MMSTHSCCGSARGAAISLPVVYMPPALDWNIFNDSSMRRIRM